LSPKWRDSTDPASVLHLLFRMYPPIQISPRQDRPDGRHKALSLGAVTGQRHTFGGLLLSPSLTKAPR